MKKTILATFAIALATILPTKLYAEDPTEYNMVITLQNGTTITLGHNDVKNITFNGEEISIEGNAVNSIEENKVRIDEMTQRLDDMQTYMEARLEEERYRTDDQITMVYNDMQSQIEEVYGLIRENQETMTQMINIEQADVQEIRDEINEYKGKLEAVYYNLQEYVDYLVNEANSLKGVIDSLSERVAALENQK